MPQNHGGDPVQAKRGKLADGVLLLADRREVALRAEAGAEVVLRDGEDVRVVWITDPEGNRIELWELPKVYRAPEKAMPME